MKGKEERNGAKGKWGKEGKGRKKGRAKGSKGGRKKRSTAVPNQSPFPYKGSSNRGNFG